MVKAHPIADLDARAATHAQCARVLGPRIDELLAYDAAVRSPDAVAELHAMRIAGKRLRYALETLTPCLQRPADGGAGAEARAEEIAALCLALEQLQDRLGHLHDLDVAAALLRDELRARLRRVRATRRALDSALGATAALGEGAQALLAELRHGAVAGVLILLAALVRQRRSAWTEFLLFWDKTLGEGFASRLRRACGLTT